MRIDKLNKEFNKIFFEKLEFRNSILDNGEKNIYWEKYMMENI